jgi:excisionase family DNA binding protein
MRSDEASAPGNPNDVLLTLSEASEFIRLGRTTFYKLLSRGEIPYVRRGGSRRLVWRSDLVAWVNRQRVASPLV